MTSWITNLIETIGYIGIAILMILETFIPIIQSEIIMPFSGFTARASDEINLYLVIFAGILGSQTGALLLYGLIRKLPEKSVYLWIGKYGKFVGFSSKKLSEWADQFSAHGRLAVLVGRFIPGIRSFVAVPAGLRKMPVLEFAIFNLIGTIFWVSILAVIGFKLGDSYRLAEQYSSLVTYGLLGIILIYMAYSFGKIKRA